GAAGVWPSAGDFRTLWPAARRGRPAARGAREKGMKYICDAPNRKTWFRIETEAEAERESELMDHAVAKHFKRAREEAMKFYRPTSERYIERDIGLKAHLERAMPLFLTLRDRDGNGLVTAMLPAGGRADPHFRIII